MSDINELLKRVDERNAKVSELQKKSIALRKEIDHEIQRVELAKYIVNNTPKIVREIDREFEEQTRLKSVDYGFLFLATALQCLRIYLINQLTKVEKAGKGNRIEDYLHKKQDELFKDKINKADRGEAGREYYSPLYRILSLRGVPYDATGYADDNYKLFKGANHRFSTFGHDPMLGLIFGTTNILTNTITCYDEDVKILGVKMPITNHVIYDDSWKNPRIGAYGLTTKAFLNAADRMDGDCESIGAALIKQIIHIGTDTFTPCGINLPFADLVLDKKSVEEITKYIGLGDVIKVGASAGVAVLINFIISFLHNLLSEALTASDRKVYNVKTRKIIMLSNTIATSSSVIKTAVEMNGGNMTAIKDMDWGGLIVTIYRLITDQKFIREVKHEFLVENFVKRIDSI